jgi:hypothetical protein
LDSKTSKPSPKPAHPSSCTGIEHAVVLVDPPPNSLVLDEQVLEVARLLARDDLDDPQGVFNGIRPFLMRLCSSVGIGSFACASISQPRSPGSSLVALEVLSEL